LNSTKAPRRSSRWAFWTLTIVLLLIAGVFLMWAIQTAWLGGSFPDRDKAQHATWAALQLGGALLFAVTPLVLWMIRRWRRSHE
jgi:hypothetical protein